MERPEYVCIKMTDIPQEFIDKYDLTQSVHNGWIYFGVLRGWYQLHQAGKLDNELLHKILNKCDYYETPTTLGLWRHKWLPIQFVLKVDNLVI